MTKHKIVHRFIITTFVTLYLFVSLISTIHVISFFELSNTIWLATTLAIAFEIGAAASLASLIVLEKMNKSMVYALFIILTAMQAMGNTYYAYSHLHDYQGWIELFGLVDYEVIMQKRILAIVSGAILPLVALGFIKSLVDYIKPDVENDVYNKTVSPTNTESVVEQPIAEQLIDNTLVLTHSINDPIKKTYHIEVGNKTQEETLEEVKKIAKIYSTPVEFPEDNSEMFNIPELPELDPINEIDDIDSAPDTDLVDVVEIAEENNEIDDIDNAPDTDLIEPTEELDDKKKTT